MEEDFINKKTLEQLNSDIRNFDILLGSKKNVDSTPPVFNWSWAVDNDESLECGNTQEFFFKLKEDCIALAVVECSFKTPVDMLTQYAKLGILMGAGIPMEYRDGKFRTLNKVSIQMIDGKYKVFQLKSPTVHYR